MKLAIPAQLAPFVDQVRRNPRLQVGLGLILLVVLAWLFLVLGDMRDAQVQRFSQARQRLAQVQQLAGQDAWVQRASESESVVAALSAEIPAAGSPGLAQAAFQGWLKQTAGVEGVRLEIQSPIYLDDPTDVVQVTGVVSGALPPRRVWQMIHRLESSMALVTIPTLNVRSDVNADRFSLTVRGYYRLPAPHQEPAP